ncbi:MAG TPA: CopD family protein [Gammaproteobacteria bacterium]|nr:CopD family protein [Gammaproteobacteria bacterium]
MLWLKSFHLIFMVTWFAGLFYLPRLFVYHAMTEDSAGNERFKVMERKLLIITHIGMALTWIFGLAMLANYAWAAFGSQGWLHAKLTLLVALTLYTVWCARIVRTFRRDANTRSHVWYRWFNEVPVVFLVAIVLLAGLKPF